MKHFKEKDLDNITNLCKINLSEQKKTEIRNDLEEILDHIDSLNEIDTSNIFLNEYNNGYLELKDDIEELSFSREDFLKNAPEHSGGMLKVPTVIGD